MSLNVTHDNCADVLRVLADATRLRIVRLLFARPRRVGQLSDALQVEQSLLSHHLGVLRKAGLVEAKREGKTVCYALAPRLARRRCGRVIDLGCCRLSFEQR